MRVCYEHVVGKPFPEDRAFFEELGLELKACSADMWGGVSAEEFIELGFEQGSQVAFLSRPVPVRCGFGHGLLLGIAMTYAVKSPQGGDAALWCLGGVGKSAQRFDGGWVLAFEEEAVGGFAVPGVGVVE